MAWYILTPLDLLGPMDFPSVENAIRANEFAGNHYCGKSPDGPWGKLNLVFPALFGRVDTRGIDPSLSSEDARADLASSERAYWIHGLDPSGPMTFGTIRALWKEKKITGGSLFCQEGDAEWKPIFTIAGKLEEDVAGKMLAAANAIDEKRIRAAYIWALVSASATLLFALFMYSEGKSAAGLGSVIDAAVAFGLAFGVKRKSPICAGLLALFGVVSTVMKLGLYPKAAAISIYATYVFVRGALSVDKWRQRNPSAPKPFADILSMIAGSGVGVWLGGKTRTVAQQSAVVPRPIESSTVVVTDGSRAPTGSDFARILGLSGDITIADVRNAYLQRIGEYSPDKLTGLGERLRQLANEDSDRLTEAYEYFVKKLG